MEGPHALSTTSADPTRDSARAHQPYGTVPVGDRFVPRDRLLAGLVHSGQYRCVVVQAPAGYGKTTVLSAWRHRLLLLGLEVCGFTVGPADNQLERGLDVLLTAFAEVDEAIAREARILGGYSGDAYSIERVVMSLVRGITASDKPIVLLVDDLHHWQEPRLLEAVQLLLDYAPPKLRFVLSSRNAMQLSLSRLRAQDELLEIGLDDLCLTLPEAAALIRAHLGEVSDQEVDAMHQLTHGWAAGLQLLCIAKKRKKAPTLAADMRNPRAFSDYFEREVLAQLSADQVHSLVCAAVPQHFSALLCADLVSDAQGQAVSHELLARLEREQLFISPVNEHVYGTANVPGNGAGRGRSAEAWWRMHPLLRDVLLNRFAQWSVNLQTTIHQRAWAAFSARGMMHDAVRHAVQAGAPEAAAQLVEATALDLFVSGELRQLAALVRLLPPATVTQRAGLRLWLAWLQVFEHRMDECAESIQALLAMQDPGDPVAHYRLVVLRGLYAVQRDDTASAQDILPELLRPPEHADVIALAGRRNILTWIYLFQGNYTDARQVQLDPGVFLFNGRRLLGSPFGMLAGRCLLGLTYSVEGDMIQAERIYREVLHEAEKQGPACIDAACLAAGLLGEVLYELDGKEAAVQLLENRLDVLEQVSIPDTVLRAMIIMGWSRRLAGLPLEAFGFMDRLEQYALARRLDRPLAYSLALQLRWHLEDHNFSVAHTLMTRLEALSQSPTQTGKSALTEVSVSVERARILLCLDSGDLSAGYARLLKLIEFCESIGFKRRAAALQVQCAAVQQRLGHPDSAAEHMRQAMRLGHKLGLLRSLLDAHKDAGALAEPAAISADQEPVLAFYAQRLIAASRKTSTQAPPLHSAVSSNDRVSKLAELSGREADVVRLLAQAMPNKKIARSLGLSPETVKWHLKNIYTKLDLTSRDEVVALCRQSALFTE